MDQIDTPNGLSMHYTLDDLSKTWDSAHYYHGDAPLTLLYSRDDQLTLIDKESFTSK